MDATNIYGNDVYIDDTTAGDPLLVIRLQNLQNIDNGAGEITDGTGIDDVSLITPATINDYGHKIYAALLKLHKQKQPIENTDPSLGTYIDFDPNSDKRFTSDKTDSNGNTIYEIEFRPTVLIRVPDQTVNFDPDDVKNS